MANVFDSKYFNAEVFKGYIDTIPNTKRTELIKSRAIRQRPDLAAAMADQEGGNFITTVLKGLVDGDALNYDGATNITASKTKTYRHSRVVVGRAKAWVENDFSYDLTGGHDFVEDVAAQIAEYWSEIDQDTIVHILNGIFKMTGTVGAQFVKEHTHDVSEATNAEGVKGMMDATTLNTAMQKACGDNKGAFSLAIMHSAIATQLENMKLLSYMKYTDENGVERELSLATLNGRLVLVDDGMPVDDGKYTTYVLGDGAIEYTDCGAKVPYEVDRDPKTNGGQDTLYSRQRKCFAPYGISFTQNTMTSLSPTDTELETGANWQVVTAGADTIADSIALKAIPIARIISTAAPVIATGDDSGIKG